MLLGTPQGCGITTLETDPQVVKNGLAGCTPRMWALALCLAMGLPLPPDRIDIQNTIFAYINHGRWIAECPHCREALPASKRYPAFWCVKCRNAKNGGAAMRIVFPLEARRIEGLLALRPEPKNRNWKPGETVADLAAENIAHGIRSVLNFKGASYGMD